MDVKRMLRILENDPRISVRDLADIMAESEESVLRTKAQLEKDKIICGYHTVINWDKANTDHCSAVIQVSARPQRDTGYDSIAMRIARFSEVTNLYLMSGGSEFLVMIEGKTMREVSDFVAMKLAPIEGITATVTCFVLKQYKVEGVIMDEDRPADERLIVQP